ncbi:hypothetical protein ABTD09_21175, partial [Acinetobacter baumannii]
SKFRHLSIHVQRIVVVQFQRDLFLLNYNALLLSNFDPFDLSGSNVLFSTNFNNLKTMINYFK